MSTQNHKHCHSVLDTESSVLLDLIGFLLEFIPYSDTGQE